MFKTVEPGGRHKALFNDLAATLRKHSAGMSQEEVLAVLAMQTGMVLALQDSRRPTQVYLELLRTNIEAGNAHAITQAALGKLKP